MDPLSTLLSAFLIMVSSASSIFNDVVVDPGLADQSCHAGDGRKRLTGDLHNVTLGGPTAEALGYPETASFGDLRVYVSDGSADALPGICAVNAATQRTAGQPVLRRVTLYAVDRGIEQSSQGRQLDSASGRDRRQVGPVTTTLDEAFVEATTEVCKDPADPSTCDEASLYIIVRPQAVE